MMSVFWVAKLNLDALGEAGVRQKLLGLRRVGGHLLLRVVGLVGGADESAVAGRSDARRGEVNDRLAVGAVHESLAEGEVLAGALVAADLQLVAVVRGRGDDLEVRVAFDDLLLFGREPAYPVECAAPQALDLTGRFRGVDESDTVEIRQLAAVLVLLPVACVLDEHGAVLGGVRLEHERTGADELLRRVRDALAEHLGGSVGERRGELRVGTLQLEADVHRVARHHLGDVGVH